MFLSVIFSKALFRNNNKNVTSRHEAYIVPTIHSLRALLTTYIIRFIYLSSISFLIVIFVMHSKVKLVMFLIQHIIWLRRRNDRYSKNSISDKKHILVVFADLLLFYCDCRSIRWQNINYDYWFCVAFVMSVKSTFSFMIYGSVKTRLYLFYKVERNKDKGMVTLQFSGFDTDTKLIVSGDILVTSFIYSRKQVN